jgi:outer membrane protein assembly factor BamE (lipoprotein component of BamABCDE complex)
MAPWGHLYTYSMKGKAMNRFNVVLLSGAILASPLLAQAAPHIAFYRDGPVRSIQPGQTKEDVRSEVGRPNSVRHMDGETHYYYSVEDNFGERATLDVAFDGDGYVVRKGEIRTMD